MFAWLGLLAIGALPAMINCNLTGGALLHCLKVPHARLVLVDDDEQLLKRIEALRWDSQHDAEMEIVVLTTSRREDIYSQRTDKVNDVYRSAIKGNDPMCLFYTRFVEATNNSNIHS